MSVNGLPPYIKKLQLDRYVQTTKKLPETLDFINRIYHKLPEVNSRYAAKEHGLQGGVIYIGEGRFVINLEPKFASGAYKSIKKALLVDRTNHAAFIVINACTHIDPENSNDTISVAWETRVAKLAMEHPSKFVEVFAVVPPGIEKKFSVIQYFYWDDLLGLHLKKWKYQGHKITLAERMQMALGITSTVEVLHRNEIAHADIKLQNILWTVIGDWQEVRAHLHDFGSCINTNKNKNYYKFMRGTLELNPPEWWNYELHGVVAKTRRPIALSADIWQLGMMFYFLFDKPIQITWLDGLEISSQYIKLYPEEFYESFFRGVNYKRSNRIACLIADMVKPDPDERPDINWVKLVLMKIQMQQGCTQL